MSYKIDESSEVWKDIEGYEGLYQVSDLGRIRRILNNDWRKERLNHPYRYLSLINRSKWGYKAVNLTHRDLLAANNILRKGISELESMCKTSSEASYACIQESHSL